MIKTVKKKEWQTPLIILFDEDQIQTGDVCTTGKEGQKLFFAFSGSYGTVNGCRFIQLGETIYRSTDINCLRGPCTVAS